MGSASAKQRQRQGDGDSAQPGWRKRLKMAEARARRSEKEVLQLRSTLGAMKSKKRSDGEIQVEDKSLRGLDAQGIIVALEIQIFTLEKKLHDATHIAPK